MALSSLSNVENILLLKVYLSSILPQNTILLEILLKVKTIFFCPRLPLHIVSKFLVADDYRLDPSYNPPFTKSDDVVANERVGVQIHEHLFTFPDIGIETGSIKDNSKKNETNNNNPTKRLGEVDYSKAESLKLQLILQGNHNHEY